MQNQQDPKKQKFEETKTAFFNDAKFTEADEAKKAKMASHFFDKVGAPYLKEAYQVNDPGKVDKMKQQFLEQISTKYGSKKKKKLFQLPQRQEVKPRSLSVLLKRMKGLWGQAVLLKWTIPSRSSTDLIHTKTQEAQTPRI